MQFGRNSADLRRVLDLQLAKSIRQLRRLSHLHQRH